MTIAQLYLAIGVPLIFNTVLLMFIWSALDRRLSELRDDIKILTSKVVELDNRMIKVETKLNI